MEFTGEVAKDGSVDLDTTELDSFSAAGKFAASAPGGDAVTVDPQVLTQPRAQSANPTVRNGNGASSPAPYTGLPPPVTAAAPASQDLMLRGRYILEEKIGEGGTSVVYRARDLRRDAAAPGGQRVALKLLRPGLRNQPRAVERLKREFHHAQTLTHPAIARVYDVDCESGAWFLTLELLEGESLARVIDRNDESLSPRRILEILRACGEALAFAHERGVVHGDFKPGNIFITQTGQVRVLDFGSASASWLSGETLGTTATPAYASPEVLSGQRPERRDDVFSFACVTYELFTRRHPFERRSALDARSANRLPDRDWNLSARQWHALESGLAWTRDERPASIRALLADVTSNEVPSPLVIPEIREPATPFRSPGLAPFSAVAAVAALAAVVFVASWQLDDVPKLPEVVDRTQQVVRELANLPPGAGPAVLEGQGTMAAVPPAVPPKPVRVSARAEESPFSNPPVSKAAAAAAVIPSARKSPPTSLIARSTSAPVAPTPAVTPARATSASFGEVAAGNSAYVSFDVDSITVSEGATSAVLRINRRHQLVGRAQVQWRTLAGSARANEDFREVARGVAEFADGQTMRAIYVPLLNDLDFEGDESFTVELFSPNASTRINPIARAKVTVRDNDGDNEFRVADQTRDVTPTN